MSGLVLVLQFVSQLFGTVLVLWAWRDLPRGALRDFAGWFGIISVAILIRRLVMIADMSVGIHPDVVRTVSGDIVPLLVSILTAIVGSRMVRAAHFGHANRPALMLGAVVATLAATAPTASEPVIWSDIHVGGPMP